MQCSSVQTCNVKLFKFRGLQQKMIKIVLSLKVTKLFFLVSNKKKFVCVSISKPAVKKKIFANLRYYHKPI